MRKKIVAGNWKMFTDLRSGLDLAIQINKLLEQNPIKESTGVIIATPFTHLHAISSVIDTDRICMAAQNCASADEGAFTGEVSVDMLKSVGVKAVIIGHSERRAYFDENEMVLSMKVNLAVWAGLKPIFCCGEQLEDRDADKQFDVVKNQITKSVFQLSPEEFKNVKIAYEPVWAIGTGKTASAEQAQEMHAFIRKLISEKHGNDIAQATTILYGGSVKPANAKEIFSMPDVDGGLIGGASLDAQSFYDICSAI